MAVTLTDTQLVEAVNVGEFPRDVRERWLLTAAAMIDRYAPGAPAAVANEAAIRLTGWLAQQPKAAVRSVSGPDEMDLAFAVSNPSGFLQSGAAALLAPWRVHRAGVIE